MANTISKYDDVIDSRDIIERIAELASERDNLQSEADDDTNAAKDEAIEALKGWDVSEDGEELKALKALEEEFEGYCHDWRHGVALIRDSHFEDYAQELAEEAGDMNSKQAQAWPFNCIDWEKAARELQQDYTSGEFDGITYWAR